MGIIYTFLCKTVLLKFSALAQAIHPLFFCDFISVLRVTTQSVIFQCFWIGMYRRNYGVKVYMFMYDIVYCRALASALRIRVHISDLYIRFLQKTV